MEFEKNNAYWSDADAAQRLASLLSQVGPMSQEDALEQRRLQGSLQGWSTPNIPAKNPIAPGTDFRGIAQTGGAVAPMSIEEAPFFHKPIRVGDRPVDVQGAMQEQQRNDAMLQTRTGSRSLQDIIAMAQQLKAAGAPGNTINTFATETAGGSYGAYGQAFNKARGTASGRASVEGTGGGGTQAVGRLYSLAGTDKFESAFDEAVATGKISTIVMNQLQGRHELKLKANTVSDPDRRTITSLRGSVDALSRLDDAYKGTQAYKTGKVSDDLNAALATMSAGGAVTAELMKGLTPDERKYVALYNTFRLNLRRVSEDSRFSNFDAQQVLTAIGNPAVGRELYTEQLGAAKNELTGRHDNFLTDIDRQRPGKSKAFPRFNQEQSSSAPEVGKVVKGYRFKGGDPSKQENWEKAQY